MPLAVTDFRSNAGDQIAYAARVLRGSARKRRLFELISSGKRHHKSVAALAQQMRLSEKQVLVAGKALVDAQLVEQHKPAGRVAYGKVVEFAAHKKRILRLATNPAALSRVPTKTNPRAVSAQRPTHITVRAGRASPVTIDDIDSLSRVRRASARRDPRSVSEARLKAGLKEILGETGRFQDWGGEQNDLFTTQARVLGSRRPTAFAFKGPATRGRLTLAKMGKNGDQVLRLFQTPADVFIVQYCGEVDGSVVAEMDAHARARSQYTNRTVYYGVINGDDTAKLLAAYPRAFGASTNPVRRRRAS